MNITLTSRAFAPGEDIPLRFTRQGENLSPPLQWSQSPAGTKSFVVVCDQPNGPSGNAVHWLVYNLPASTTGLPEGLPTIDPLPNGARHGVNDFNRTGYSGPHVPTAGIQRYIFQVYALNVLLPARPGMTKSHVIQAMESHLLARGRLVCSLSAAAAAAVNLPMSVVHA